VSTSDTILDFSCFPAAHHLAMHRVVRQRKWFESGEIQSTYWRLNSLAGSAPEESKLYGPSIRQGIALGLLSDP
jgi:hypothetical protein